MKNEAKKRQNKPSIATLEKIIEKQSKQINKLRAKQRNLASQIKSKNNLVKDIILQNTGLKISNSLSIDDFVLHLCNYYENLIKHMPGHVYWKDKNGMYLGCNDGQAKTLGYTSGRDIIGKTDFDLPWSEQAAELQRIDKEVMKTGHEYVVEEPVDLPDGQTGVFLSRKVPLHGQKDEVVGILGVSINIIDRKRMEENMLIAKQKAEIANEAKNQFISNMEHDLRTPCSGVAAMTRSLEQNESNQSKKEILGEIAKASEQLLEILNGILAFDYIESGTLPILHKKFDIRRMLDNIVAIETPYIKYKDLEIIAECSEDIPASLLCDEQRLSRILLNLVSNAVKFTKKGFVKISIDIAKKIGNKHVILRILVKDTGIGIPENMQGIIYERFSRIHPTNQGVYAGSGLGLCIVKQFMEDLQGEIGLESDLGNGTSFECLIPCEVPLLLQTDIDSLENKGAGAKKNIGNNKSNKTDHLKILLVEDDALARRVAVMMLEENFTRNIDVAITGNDALKLLAKNKYSLVFMDLGLPDISGLEVTERIRSSRKKLNKEAIIIALTAHDSKHVQENCISSGMNGFLTKPLNAEKTRAIIDSWVT